MKNISHLLISLIIIALSGCFILSEAQYKSDVQSTFDWTGPVTKSTEAYNPGLFGLMDFRMDHSYEMSVGSFGGNMYNQNYYTNTMHFLFNENLYGRVDLALAHSPLGNSMMGDEPQFIVRNAEINYRFNNNSHIRLSFNQQPRMYGMGGIGNPYHMGHSHSPFYSPHGFGQQNMPHRNTFHGW